MINFHRKVDKRKQNQTYEEHSIKGVEDWDLDASREPSFLLSAMQFVNAAKKKQNVVFCGLMQVEEENDSGQTDDTDAKLTELEAVVKELLRSS